MRAFLSRIDSTATLVGTAVIIGCTAFIMRQRAPAPLSQQLASPAAAARGKYQVVTVFQLGDCEGRLDFVKSLAQSPAQARVQTRMLFVGSGKDFQEAQRRVKSRLGGVTLEHAGSRAVTQLRPIGYDMTPFIVVLDPSGRVRATLPGPEATGSAADVVGAAVRQVITVDSTMAAPAQTADAETPAPRRYADAAR